MQHEILPPIAKRTLAAAYALAGVALLVAATQQSDAWVGALCALGALLLVLAAVVSFAETAARTKAAPDAPAPEPNAPEAPAPQPAAEESPAQEPQATHAEPKGHKDAKAPETAEAPTPAPAPAPEPEPKPPAAASQPSSELSPETLQLIMIRSQDTLSTLRELATHDPESALSCALSATGILELDDDTRFGCAHLRRSKRFWFQTDLSSAPKERYDILTSAEAALNTYQDALLAPSASGDVLIRMREVFARIPRATYEAESKQTLTNGKAGMDGEWGTRLRFAEFCENVALPFRMSYDFDVNLRDGAFDIIVNVPRPRCFSYLAHDDGARARAARAYALDVAQTLAQGAFDANEQIAHVQVRCHEQGKDETILTLLIDRDDLSNGRVSTSLRLDLQGLRDAGYAQATIDESGWYAPLEENSNRLAALLERPDRWIPPELRQGELPKDLALASGAQTFKDLSINESAARREAWKGFEAQLDGTLGQAVKELVALRDASPDLSVIEAANRLADALVNDVVDVEDTAAMQRLFINGSSLDQACAQARAAIDNGDHDAKEAALARLEAELAPLMETGLYFDDELNVYRYFNSMPERIAYNLKMDDAPRSVRIVPDAYYAAHSLALRIHGLLGNAALAFEHADELMRVAPCTSDATLAKVRLLEEDGQIIEAANLLCELIASAPTLHAMGLAFYRLAFMEWKLGRSDLSVACYERAIDLSPTCAQQAEPELSDLLKTEPELKRLKPEQAKAALVEAGIPLGDDDALFERLARSAQATTDAEVFSVAWQLASFYADARHDDISVAVYRSLSPSS